MKIVPLLLLTLSLSLAACSKGGHAPAEPSPSMPQMVDAASGKTAAAPKKFIALSHRLTMLLPADQLQPRSQALQAQCLQAGCEILSVDTQTATHGQAARATMTARVPPAAFERFFAATQAQGTLLAHYATAEDKTAQVIDVEARINNLEAFKGRILELLAKRTASLKEALEAEQQLANTQAELDSIREQRRRLASETEMVRIEINLVTERGDGARTWSAPITSALKDAGSVLAASLGGLITFAVAVLPWALAGWLLLWIPIRRLWRRRKLNAAKAADPVR